MDLDGLLSDIAHLKEERYIGTRQAWGYLKAREHIDTLPDRLALDVSARIVPAPPARPRPEHIIGILETMRNIIDLMRAVTLDTDNDAQQVSDWRGRWLIDDYHYILYEADQDQSAYANVVDTLADAYTCISGDDAASIGSMVASRILDTYPLDDDGQIYLQNAVTSTDWSSALSPHKLSEWISHNRRAVRWQYLLNDLDERLMRIENDGVDHRLDRRRELTVDYAASRSITSYDNLIDWLDTDKRTFARRRDEAGVFMDRKYWQQKYHTADKLRAFAGADKQFLERYLPS